MRYMMFIKHDADYDVRNVPQSLFAAMGEFVGDEIKKGRFIDGAGLKPLVKGTRVRLAGGNITVNVGINENAEDFRFLTGFTWRR